MIEHVSSITGTSPCSQRQFPCNDGVCIEHEQVCDETFHCLDDEDEDPLLCSGDYNNYNPNLGPGMF